MVRQRNARIIMTRWRLEVLNALAKLNIIVRLLSHESKQRQVANIEYDFCSAVVIVSGCRILSYIAKDHVAGS